MFDLANNSHDVTHVGRALAQALNPYQQMIYKRTCPDGSWSIETFECAQHGRFDTLVIYGRDGKQVNSVMCPGCLEEELKEENRRASREACLQLIRSRTKGIPERYVGVKPTDCTDLPAEFIDTARDFCKGSFRNLVMLGNVGTGKTMLACSIGNYLAYKSATKVLYVTESEIMRTLRNSFATGSGEINYLNRLKDAGLLIIDEAGDEKDSDFRTRTYKAIIGGRYDKKLQTIVISNLSPKSFYSLIGSANKDRLQESGRQLIFAGSSYRGKQQELFA